MEQEPHLLLAHHYYLTVRFSGGWVPCYSEAGKPPNACGRHAIRPDVNGFNLDRGKAIIDCL